MRSFCTENVGEVDVRTRCCNLRAMVEVARESSRNVHRGKSWRTLRNSGPSLPSALLRPPTLIRERTWRTIALRSVAATVQSLRVPLRRYPTPANHIARVSPSWRSPCWTLRSSRSFSAALPYTTGAATSALLQRSTPQQPHI
jgi:hypothetical protein